MAAVQNVVAARISMIIAVKRTVPMTLSKKLVRLSVPLHQAMVLLSNGAGRNDPGSTALSAEAMKLYFNKGRFPEDNKAAPKTPLPVISVHFPNKEASFAQVNDFNRTNDVQFMQDIANPEIGGFFDVVREGEGVTKGRRILEIVKGRFDKMWVVKWRMSCLAPTLEQSFTLGFVNIKNTVVKPDASFENVPIGIDPTQWPLDINVAQTKAEADANPIYPGGTFRVYGDFCWGGDKQRAEAYFVPAGTKPDPNVNKSDPEVAKRAIQQLIAQNMRGGAIEASDTFVQFQVPDEEKILEGTGENAVARLVVYDNKAARASAYDEKAVLTLKAAKKPVIPPTIAFSTGMGVLMMSDPSAAPPMTTNSDTWMSTPRWPPTMTNPPNTEAMTMTEPTMTSIPSVPECQ